MKNWNYKSGIFVLTKSAAVILVVAFCMLLSGPAHAADQAANVIKVKLGHDKPAGNPMAMGADFLAKEVDKGTKGAVKIQIFGSSQLGGEREMIEGLQSGFIEMAITNTVAVSVFEKRLQVLGLPFLFKSPKDASKVLAGPVGDDLFKNLKNKNIIVLGVWRGASRDIVTNNKVINKMEDLKGLRIRSMETPVTVDFLKALGALPIIMPYNDVYIGLQTGTIDGCDVATVLYETDHMDDVAKNLARIRWSYGTYTVMASKAFWEKLTPAQQKVIKDAALAAAKVDDDEYDIQEKNLLTVLKGRKVVVTTPDVESFKKAVSELYVKKWEPAYGKDLVEKLRAGK